MVPREIAVLTIRLTDYNVIKVIQMSRNSPQKGQCYNEILDAFEHIGGARRHLTQLMVEESHLQAPDDWWNSSENSVIERLVRQSTSDNRNGRETL